MKIFLYMLFFLETATPHSVYWTNNSDKIKYDSFGQFSVFRELDGWIHRHAVTACFY